MTNGTLRWEENLRSLLQVPEYLQHQKRWSVFRKIWNPERNKYDKIVCTPLGGNPHPGYPNPENQNDFGTFENIKKLIELDNTFAPAFYLLKSDGIIFMDFDAPCAIPNYPTYTERSISGGYHCLGWYDGAKPVLKETKEVYQEKRWIVLTGDIVSDKKDINNLTDLFLGMQLTTPASTTYTKFIVKDSIPAGGRNNFLFSYAASMRARGSTPAAIEAALLIENRLLCKPPLPEDEVKAIAASGSKYKPGNLPLYVGGSPAPALAAGSCQTSCPAKRRIDASPSTGEFVKVEAALSAIVEVFNNPSPQVFVRSGRLCRIVFDEKGIPSIERLEQDSLSVILTQCIDWFFKKKRIDKSKIPHESYDVEILTITPQLLVSRLNAMGCWKGVPPLIGITESPYITDDGSIISTPGYNPQTKLYLAQQKGFKDILVPDCPTKEDLERAKKRLFDLFDEFTFEDESSRENHIACLITAAIRPIIKGVVPLFVYDKPVMGSGASLLAEIISGITTGRPASMTQIPSKKNEGEMNKLIMGLLREGRSLNVFDNVEGDIYSSALAQLISQPVYNGRVLGKNATESYENNALWIVNGNNIQITHDLPRRCVWVRLATETTRPYERTNWKIPHIRVYSIEHQSEYLSAILTIVSAWYLAGKPGPDKKLQVIGGFEEWRDTLGGIMRFINCNNFLKNTAMNLDITEEAHEDIEIFLEEIFLAFPEKKGNDGKWIYETHEDGKKFTRIFAVKDIIPIADPVNYLHGNGGVRIDRMPPYLQEMNREHPKKLPQAIGSLFRKNIGRVLPVGYKLDRDKIHHKVATYRVSYKEPIKKQDDDDEVSP